MSKTYTKRLGLLRKREDMTHEQFVRHWMTTHAALCKKLPGLRKYEVSQGPVASPAGASGIYLVAILTFDNMAAVQAAFGSEEGKATAGDLKNFASGGVDLVFFDTKDA